MKINQLICFTCLFCLFFTQALTQRYINISKNEFGLQVINNIQSYQQTVSLDSNKRMVALENFIFPLQEEWKYATTDNFTHQVLYHAPIAFLRLPAAKALRNVAAELKKNGLGIKIFDAYRPYRITKLMWKFVPDERYAANPAKGSGHNRGIAIDLTLVDLKTGKDLPMPTAFDDFTQKAHYDYMQLDRAVLANRKLLRTIMEQFGFKALDTEWWHFYWPDNRFELMDLGFEKLEK